MPLFTNLGKRTKILLWAFLGLVIVSAGALIWLNQTGRLKSSADVVNCFDCQFATIRGKVTYQNGNPINGAQILLQNMSNSSLNKSTKTSADGTYGFTNVPQQKGATNTPWSVTASYNDGCGTSSKTLGIAKIWTNGEVIYANFTLSAHSWVKGRAYWETSKYSDPLNNPDSGYPGMNVKLYTSLGQLLASTTTGSHGYYQFYCKTEVGMQYYITYSSSAYKGQKPIFTSILPGNTINIAVK